MRAAAFIGALVVSVAIGGAQAPQPPAMYSPEWYARFSGPYSQPAVPFPVVGNVHYVGAANIASYLIATPEGHFLIDTGMKEMYDVIRMNVEALGFKTSDIEILLSTQAHFDHVEGHAAIQKLTGGCPSATNVRRQGRSDQSGRETPSAPQFRGMGEADC